MTMRLFHLLLISALTSQVIAAVVPSSDAHIEVCGTRYFQVLETGQRYQRHREDALQLPRKELGINPDTPIYCISLLYTKKPVNENTGHTVNEYRTSLSKLVKGRKITDKNLHFIAGEEITNVGNLRAENPKDPMHLSEEGAALLAEALYPILKLKEER